MKPTVRVSTLIVVLVLAGCREDLPTAPASPGFEIKDGAHSGGNGGFYFLPPLVTAPGYTGKFDAMQTPEVRICVFAHGGCGAEMASYTMTAGQGSEVVRVSAADEHYIVNWHTDQFALDPALTYRISVLVAGTELGHADVDVVGSGKELKNVNTGEFIPLLDGRTLPIRFRIEEGAVVVIGPDGGSLQSDDGNATITVPPGMFAEPVGFTVQALAVPASEIAEAGLVPGTAYTFGPSGMVFPEPGVTVTLKYDPANLGTFSASELTLLTEIDDLWAEIPNPTVDQTAGTVTAQVGHFSNIVTGVSRLATIDQVALTMYMGDPPGTLTHTIGGLTRFIAWYSRTPGVATVTNSADGENDGIVTAIAPGAARIGVSSYDPYYGGWTDEVFVAVLAGPLPPDQLQWFVQREGVTGNALFAVGGTSPTDVFLVGFDGTVIHYDGTTPTIMTTPTTCTYRGVWARAPNDVYVVGRCAAGFGSRLLHYNGSSWNVIHAPIDGLFWNLHGNADYVFVAAGDRVYRYPSATPDVPLATFPATVTLRAVAAKGSSVVAVGQDGANGVMFISPDNGETWTAGSTPVDYWGWPASGPLLAVWRDPGQPLIVASTLDGRVVMYREDWGMWAINEQLTGAVLGALTSKPKTAFTNPDVFLGGDNGELAWAERCRCGFGAPGFRSDQFVKQHVLGLWTDGPTGRVWGVGTAGLIFHQTSSSSHSFDVLARGQSYSDVWLHPSGRVIAGSASPNNEVWMSSSLGTDWGMVALQPYGAGFQGAFGAADGSEAYVVGRNGAIARGTPSGSGYAFTNLTSGTTQELFDVWVSPGGVVYTAGRAGTLLKSTNHGASWAQAGSFGTQEMNQIYGFSDNEVIVTSAGDIYRTTNGGNTWSQMRAGFAGERFSGLWAASSNEIWAVGREPTGPTTSQGVIVHTHGNVDPSTGRLVWVKQTFSGNRYLGGAWGDGAGSVYAGGSGGTVLLLQGHADGDPEPPTWSPQATGTTKDLFAVFGANVPGAGQVVFSTGAAGTIITGVRP
jgi:photosystem II stability/assembly factor-like uncharacterized protein